MPEPHNLFIVVLFNQRFYRDNTGLLVHGALYLIPAMGQYHQKRFPPPLALTFQLGIGEQWLSKLNPGPDCTGRNPVLFAKPTGA